MAGYDRFHVSPAQMGVVVVLAYSELVSAPSNLEHYERRYGKDWRTRQLAF